MIFAQGYREAHFYGTPQPLLRSMPPNRGSFIVDVPAVIAATRKI